MKATKCDRCGKFFTENPHCLSNAPINELVYCPNEDSFKINPDSKRYDLCEECAKAFDRFMSLEDQNGQE